ncbi:MAG TPA: hypothetical protein VFT34_01375 [Verrucomicrobiae bacterium]|nr:hypothetical protein [Verrucomicrobiae bacterium]
MSNGEFVQRRRAGNMDCGGKRSATSLSVVYRRRADQIALPLRLPAQSKAGRERREVLRRLGGEREFTGQFKAGSEQIERFRVPVSGRKSTLLPMANMAMSAAVLLCLFAAGCATPPSSGTGLPYQGISSHWIVCKDDTNLREPYKAHPLYGEDAKQRAFFRIYGPIYLNAINSDLEQIDKKAANALEKLTVVADALKYPGIHFRVAYTGSVLSLGRSETNLDPVTGYPEFPDFRAHYPQPPIYSDEVEMILYKHRLLDFSATVEGYLKDGEQFIRNCKSDYETIKKIRIQFVLYLDQLKASGVPLNINTW